MDFTHLVGARFAPPNETRWYACYTRGRHEKRVATLLDQRGIENFLPLHARMEQWNDRKKRVLWPLFPSYVFVRFDLRDLPRVLGVYGVVTVVRVGSVPVPIPDEDVENVRRFAAAIEAHGLEPEPEPYLAVGERVRVGAGPLSGVEGIVVQRRGLARVLVGLQAVGQGLSIEVDAAVLIPLDGAATIGRGVAPGAGRALSRPVFPDPGAAPPRPRTRRE